ncbi:hypothetical protein AbraCBS73388_011197 [Aspergillus brasiliensis]|uniref:DUF6594 domain-containing protein n=1 Tax=Aspergillus brasiliensis TaxID=319629 RepID=A0A9W5YYB3_9EURO|nr:hypothetical protein AbraCBS73388_011197 [Aspergillus brasiliensis]
MALDTGSCIFRRFSKLNAKNLFYLQSELAYLEEDIDRFTREGRRSKSQDTDESVPYSVLALIKSQKAPKGYSEHWLKICEARKLLNEYNAALLQQAQLLKLSRPEAEDLKVLQLWLAQEQFNKPYSHSLCQWVENGTDLIALHSRHDNTDKLTRMVYTKDIKDLESGVWYYDNEKIKAATYMVSLLMSGILPATSVIALYFIQGTFPKLVTIFVYNIIFVLVMGLMVKARRVEIFATAAAFAAIQVTILTSGNGNS